ncbi:MAG: hypothetical protein A4S14_05095 [Proteobacteria bacterium SG_bin9]|nr:MAG: hypothetical protein A4S14_05095 [Proteobacteria bacterium SG_bin9]
MRRIIVLVALAAINAHLMPAAASECASNKDIDASRSRWAALRSQSVVATDREKACRAYAVSFYESVTTRQAAMSCAYLKRTLPALDSEIDAFNNLLADTCAN